jgi:hypothetical protein
MAPVQEFDPENEDVIVEAETWPLPDTEAVHVL